MPRYRVHRIKEVAGEAYRWAPHAGGEAIVKIKDYEAGRTVIADNPYAAWRLLADESEPLSPGDMLEVLVENPLTLEEATQGPLPAAQLLIAKYIGFEPAKWFVSESKPESRFELPSLSSDSSPSKTLQP